jgi:4-amino-4-deoxy-L-arabinose transferase-like glycosyltransferase
MQPLRKFLTRPATSVVLIAIIALAARLGFAWDQVHKMPPAAVGIVPFQQETGNIAYALADGRGFSSAFRTNSGPTAWLTPVYPLLVAGVFRILGVFTAKSFFAVIFLNSLFSAAACVPIFYAGKKIGGLLVASIAAWIWAIFPNAVMMPFEWVWDTTLSALLAATILWATFELADSRRLRDWILYGLLWGFTLMTNPALGTLLPFLLGWAVWRAKRDGHLKIARPLLALLMVILCCAPWTIRNYFVLHRFVPLRSNFAFELWLGNNDIFDPHAVNGRKVITRFEEERRYTQLREMAYMQEKWSKAIPFIKTHPALVLQLSGRKIFATWLGTETPWHDFSTTDSAFIRLLFISNFLVSIGVIAGAIVLLLRRNPYWFPLIVAPKIYPLLYYITHTSLRYRHAIDPILILLVAAGIVFPFAGNKQSDRSTAENQEGATSTAISREQK